MPKPRRSAFGGCLFVLSLCVVACALLMTNGMFVSLFYSVVNRTAFSWFQDEKYAEGITRGVMFVGPVLLLVLEWWLADACVDWLARMRGPRKPNSSLPR